MNRFGWLGFLCVASVACTLVAEEPSREKSPIVVSEMAKAIHRTAPVIDGHNDLPWAIRDTEKPFHQFVLNIHQPQFHTDIPRLRQGGVGAQFWSVYVPASTSLKGNALTTTLEQIDLVKQIIAAYPQTFELAGSTEEIERIRGEGKIASLIGVEGGHSIEESLNVLRQLYTQGARYMTLTHSMSLTWADSCSDDPICGGLSPFGEEVVREMNRMGMIVDLSHVSPDCMRQALAITKAPVMFSHSSARQVADHPRNVPDDVLKLTRENGGVVMVNFFPDFVNATDARRSLMRSEVSKRLRKEYTEDLERATGELRKWEQANPRSGECDVHDVLDHIDHIVRVAGIDHVGLGSDFDGVPALPKQLDDVSTYPVLTQGMLDRGYTEADIRKVLGGNLMRVFGEVEQVSRRLSRSSEASQSDPAHPVAR